MAFENMVDLSCEFIGVRRTIAMLVENYEFTREEILEINFDPEDVADYFQDEDENYW